MKILFDHGTPVPLRRFLQGHDVSTAYEMGWSKMTNGDLLNAAQEAGFDVLLTTDQNLRYQQDLSGRHISLVILTAASWPRVQRVIPEIVGAIQAASVESFVEVEIPV